MELAEIFKALWSRKLLMLLVVIAAAAAALVVKATAKSISKGTATAQVIVDSPDSLLADLRQDPAALSTRASVFAQVMASSGVIAAIGQATGIPPAKITAEGPFSGQGLILNVVTPSPARGVQLGAQTAPYRLTFVAQTTLPIITISAQAPTRAAAARLANGVSAGVTSYVQALQAQTKTNPAKRVTIRQLGPAQSATVNSSSATLLMAVAAGAILLLGILGVLGLGAVARQRRAWAELEELDVQLELGPEHELNGAVASVEVAARLAGQRER